MSEEQDSPRSAAGDSSNAKALALAAASRAKADTYLDEQIRLSRLQSENLIEQNAYELSHLRWRRFDDQMRGALQIMAVALGLLIVVGIAAAVWNASKADGLVVDAFSVPPDMAQSGIGGDVVADDMTAKIAAIRDFANDNSLARSSDVSEDRSRDVKVEIPETGISLAEAWRYLKLWFGHERHLTGNLRTRPGGELALTVSLGGGDSFTFAGKDLDALEQKAAERVFATVDPINTVLYLNGKERRAEALTAALNNIAVAANDVDRAEAYALYGNMVRYLTGDARRSRALSLMALSLDPKGTPQHMELLNDSRALGHDEEILRQARIIPTLRRADNVGSWRSPTSSGFAYAQQLAATWSDRETGDFTRLSIQTCAVQCSPGDEALLHAEARALLHDLRGAEDAIALARDSASVAGGTPDARLLARTHYFERAEQGDWQGAVVQARAYGDSLTAGASYSRGFGTALTRILAAPLLATAEAHAGDFAAAHRTIDVTPADCYDCLRARGNIDALQHDWAGAAYWFERAVAQAPSIPFAYLDWGAMLLAKGDPDSAIAKFAQAQQRGPHFADPLVLWGEALIAENRSDLALAKFAEAARDAPYWGRLHLEWGEALLWSGDKDRAAKQFVTAAALDLTPAERTELSHLPK